MSSLLPVLSMKVVTLVRRGRIPIDRFARPAIVGEVAVDLEAADKRRSLEYPSEHQRHRQDETTAAGIAHTISFRSGGRPTSSASRARSSPQARCRMPLESRAPRRSRLELRALGEGGVSESKHTPVRPPSLSMDQLLCMKAWCKPSLARR